jgi:hypothetical protein
MIPHAEREKIVRQAGARYFERWRQIQQAIHITYTDVHKVMRGRKARRERDHTETETETETTESFGRREHRD